jgi:hypothetical protein
MRTVRGVTGTASIAAIACETVMSCETSGSGMCRAIL